MKKHTVYISAGKVGLGVVEAVLNGLPVIYNKNQYHSPEVEILDNSNSLSFNFDRKINIEEILQIYKNDRFFVNIKKLDYSVDGMSNRFLNSIMQNE